jgi:hypothetical protein
VQIFKQRRRRLHENQSRTSTYLAKHYRNAGETTDEGRCENEGHNKMSVPNEYLLVFWIDLDIFLSHYRIKV